ncbi:MAG: 1-deoxy-D-xylulose-5-phosphate reductoisomerase [Alphaproteobacteria bacterium]
MAKTINILGVTGSIGQSTVDVVCSAPDAFDVNVICAHRDAAGLGVARERLGAAQAVLTQGGTDELLVALAAPVDLTVAAISGFAGLEPLLAAIPHSKAVAIANKEPLVAAGDLVLAECAKYGTKILPLDSEHNAIFQVFDEEQRSGIDRVILSASGGPFREWSLEDMRKATPEQAIAHPNWSMGRKISVDSASMMNKALEIIEAHYLFNMPPERIDVIVHPQSVVHSFVEYADGSVLAQMGASDMRTPIAHCLAYPARMETPGARLDLKAMARLDFSSVDDARFPAIGLAYAALRGGQGACIALNASNEVAVDAFLAGRIGFMQIVDCVRAALDANDKGDLRDLMAIIAYDRAVRDATDTYINGQIKKAV